jgi:hypothetical protein
MLKNRYMLNTHSQAITEVLNEILSHESDLLPESRISFAEKRQERDSSESTMATDEILEENVVVENNEELMAF